MSGKDSMSAPMSPYSTSGGSTPGHSVAGQERVAIATGRQARGVEGAPGDEQLRAFARRQVGADGRAGAGVVRVEHQDLQRVAHVVVVELVRSYAVHDDLGVRGDQEVEGRAVGTFAAVIVGLRQRSGGYLQGLR
jgi:hypothetical protein